MHSKSMVSMIRIDFGRKTQTRFLLMKAKNEKRVG